MPLACIENNELALLSVSCCGRGDIMAMTMMLHDEAHTLLQKAAVMHLLLVAVCGLGKKHAMWQH